MAAIEGWQLIREMLPASMESDQALEARMVFLLEIIEECGIERFQEAIRLAIRTKEYRNEVSVGYIRKCAGLSLALPPNPSVQAWETVTDIVTNHLVRNPGGGYSLQAKTKRVEVKPGVLQFVAKPVPEITPDVQRAVDLLGGWAALAEAHPIYWAQRYQMFCQIYREGAVQQKGLVRVQAQR